MTFVCYGPSEVPRNGGVIANDKQAIGEFWRTVNADCEEGLQNACGVYVFAIRRSGANTL